MIDQYVDYLAMFINFEALKALMDKQSGEVQESGNGFGDFVKVNKDFETKKNNLLKGIAMPTGQRIDIAQKMKDLKERLSEAQEGFIEVDGEGNEVAAKDGEQ